MLARGARFTRVPWVLVATTTMSLLTTVRAGVLEVRVIGSLVAYRLEQATGLPADPRLVKKLTLDLYLAPKREPDVTSLDLPLARLARKWLLRGVLARDTRRRPTRRSMPPSGSTSIACSRRAAAPVTRAPGPSRTADAEAEARRPPFHRGRTTRAGLRPPGASSRSAASARAPPRRGGARASRSRRRSPRARTSSTTRQTPTPAPSAARTTESAITPAVPASSERWNGSRCRVNAA